MSGMSDLMASMGIWAVIVMALGLFVVGLVIYWAVRLAMRHERNGSAGGGKP